MNMTQEEFDSLKVGSEVLLKAVVSEVDQGDPTKTLKFDIGGQSSWIENFSVIVAGAIPKETIPKYVERKTRDDRKYEVLAEYQDYSWCVNPQGSLYSFFNHNLSPWEEPRPTISKEEAWDKMISGEEILEDILEEYKVEGCL